MSSPSEHRSSVALRVVESPREAPAIRSEVAPLRRVLVHRPGPEIARLTPANMAELLFDDVPWPEGAGAEHDAFCRLLRAHGAEVLYLSELLADVLANPLVRHHVIEATLAGEQVAPSLAGPLEWWLGGLDAAALTSALIAGVTVDDLELSRQGLAAQVLGAGAFALPPLPNHMFTRDSWAWVADQEVAGIAAAPARRRERLHFETIQRYHPLFSDAPPPAGDRRPGVEGGDLLVVSRACVIVGMGQRTTPAAVERLAATLLRAGEVETLLAVQIPRERRTLHLDALMTMVDRDAFVADPAVAHLPAFALTAAGVEALPSLPAGLARELGVAPRWITAGAETERELWSDANNTLALAPGVVVAYDRNLRTNEALAAAGIEVLTFPGAEVGRGRGGPRCLSCPLNRSAG